MAESISQAGELSPLYYDLSPWNTAELPVLHNANRQQILRQKPHNGAFPQPIPSPLSNIVSDQLDSIDFSTYRTPALVRSLFHSVVRHKTSWINGDDLRRVAIEIFRKTQDVGLICYSSRKHSREVTANDFGRDDGPLVAELVTRSTSLDLSPGFAETIEDLAPDASAPYAHSRNTFVIDFRKLEVNTVDGGVPSPRKRAGYFVANTSLAPFFLNRDKILRNRVAGPLPEFTVIETGNTVLFWWGSAAAVDYTPNNFPIGNFLRVSIDATTGGSENNGRDAPPPPKKPKLNLAPPLKIPTGNNTNQEDSHTYPFVHSANKGPQQGDPAQFTSTFPDSTSTYILPSSGFPNLEATCHLCATFLLFFCHPSIHEFLAENDNRDILSFVECDFADQTFSGLAPVVALWDTLYECPDPVAADRAQRLSIRDFLENYSLNYRRSEDAGETFTQMVNGSHQYLMFDSLFRIGTADIKRSNSGCGHVFTREDSAVLWLLPINENKDLQSCIDAWFLPGEVADNDLWRCSACHYARDKAGRVALEDNIRARILLGGETLTNAEVDKRVHDRVGNYVKYESVQRLRILPEALFVQLARFRQTSNPAAPEKISTEIRIQERIRVPVGDDESFGDYVLCGAIVHGGSGLQGGHYVAAIRNPAADTSERKAWMIYNDKACDGPTYVADDDELNDFLHTKPAHLYPNRVPYILSYRRVPPSSTASTGTLLREKIDGTHRDQSYLDEREKPSLGNEGKGLQQPPRDPPQSNTSNTSSSPSGASHSSSRSGSLERFTIPPAPSIGFVNEGSTCHLTAALTLFFSHPGVRYFMNNTDLDSLRSFTYKKSFAGESPNVIKPLEPICDLWEIMQHQQHEWRYRWRHAQGIIIRILLENLGLRHNCQADAAETLQGILFEVGAQGTPGSLATFTQETTGILDCEHSTAKKIEQLIMLMLPIDGFHDVVECIDEWGRPGEATGYSCQTCRAQRDNKRIEDGQASVKDIEDEKKDMYEQVLDKYPTKTHSELEEDVRHHRSIPRQLRQVLSIKSCPEVFLIQLERFLYINEEGDRTSYKISDFCEIPARLSIMQNTDPPATRTYVLCGVIAHIGHTMESGHYVTMIRVDMTRGVEGRARWRLYDDDNVNPTGSEPRDGQEEEDTEITTTSQLNEYLHQNGRTPYILSYRPADTIYWEMEEESVASPSTDSSSASDKWGTRQTKIRDLLSQDPPPRLAEILAKYHPKSRNPERGNKSPTNSRDVTVTPTQTPGRSESGESVTLQTSQSPRTIDGGDGSERTRGSGESGKTDTLALSELQKQLEIGRLKKARLEKETFEKEKLNLQLENARLEKELLTFKLATEQQEKENREKEEGEINEREKESEKEKDPPKQPAKRKTRPKGKVVRKTYCPNCKRLLHNLQNEKKAGHLKKHDEKLDLKDCLMLTAEEYQAWYDGGPTPGGGLVKWQDEELKRDEEDEEKPKTGGKKRAREGAEEGDPKEKPAKKQKTEKDDEGTKDAEEDVEGQDKPEGHDPTRKFLSKGASKKVYGKTLAGKRPPGKIPAGKHPPGKKPAGKKPAEKRPPTTKPTNKSRDEEFGQYSGNEDQSKQGQADEEVDEEEQRKTSKRKRNNDEGEEEVSVKRAGKHPAGKKPAEKRLPAGKRLPENEPGETLYDDVNAEQDNHETRQPGNEIDLDTEAEREEPSVTKRKRNSSEGEEEVTGKKRQKTGGKQPARKRLPGKGPPQKRLPVTVATEVSDGDDEQVE